MSVDRFICKNCRRVVSVKRKRRHQDRCGKSKTPMKKQAWLRANSMSKMRFGGLR